MKNHFGEREVMTRDVAKSIVDNALVHTSARKLYDALCADFSARGVCTYSRNVAMMAGVEIDCLGDVDAMAGMAFDYLTEADHQEEMAALRSAFAEKEVQNA